MATKWFSALLVQESTHPGEDNPRPLFEADVLVIRAASEAEARRKAEQFGKSAEHEYLNAEGQRVAWVFREILDVKELDAEKIRDGAEVYYAFLSREDVEHLRRALERKVDEPG